jgi:OmpA family
MFDEEDREIGYALLLAIGVAILVSIFSIGMAGGSAIGKFGGKPKAAAPTAALPVAAESSGSGNAAAAPLPVMKIYFELGKADVPADVRAELAPLLRAAREQRRAWVISGYHDDSGDAAANAELAKQRAFAVRDLVVAAGISTATIELTKPTATRGGADPREGRRVEVSLR